MSFFGKRLSILNQKHNSNLLVQEICFLCYILKLWNEGKIVKLVKEARAFPNSFRNSTNTKRTQDDSACSFTKSILEGKTACGP